LLLVSGSPGILAHRVHRRSIFWSEPRVLVSHSCCRCCSGVRTLRSTAWICSSVRLSLHFGSLRTRQPARIVSAFDFCAPPRCFGCSPLFVGSSRASLTLGFGSCSLPELPPQAIAERRWIRLSASSRRPDCLRSAELSVQEKSLPGGLFVRHQSFSSLSSFLPPP
jgi:hypothetical protein